LGEKWIPAIIPLQFLAFYGLFRSLSATTGSIFMSTGKPKILQRIVQFQLIVLAPFLYHFTKFFDIVGVSLIMVTSLGLGLIYALREVGKILNIKYWQYLDSLKYSFFSSIFSIALVKILFKFFSISPSIISLILFIFMVAFIYFFLILIFERESIREILNIIGISLGKVKEEET
jgi:PST family polysaccharide transporter/lipopolysaccharide exporter